MKDFVKWLGVNEKVAKIAVWMLIFMGFLIIINTALESLGLPFYKVTVENLSNIKVNKVINYLSTVIISYLNFMSIVFLVFDIKRIREVLPYSVIYIIFMMIISTYGPYILSQIYIFAYIIILFLHLSKNKKIYILFGILSIIINAIIEYICYYLFKFQYLSVKNVIGINRLITSLDYFIVMFFIIISKEIYLKYRKKEV